MSKIFNKLRDDMREALEDHPHLYDAKVSLTLKKYAITKTSPRGEDRGLTPLVDIKSERLAISYGQFTFSIFIAHRIRS